MNSLPAVEVMQRIHEYIAPHILGASFIKEILALQMFTEPNMGEKFNVLIVGDKSTGKSEIAGDIVRFMPRSLFVGKESSGVGIIDEIKYMDNGFVFIDEFDKISKIARHSLLEPLSLGTITETKHNNRGRYQTRINATFLCNPKSPLVENMSILPQINFGNDFIFLSRVHLILPIFPVDSSLYPEIAVGMVNRIYDEKRFDLLREILIGIKIRYRDTKISDSIARDIGYYVKELKLMSKYPELITPRSIEGFLAMIKARARMSYHKDATRDDFEYVTNIMDKIHR